MQKEKILLQWSAPEYPDFNRGKVWKIAALSIVFTAIVLSIINKAYTFALITILLAFIYYRQNYKKPAQINIKLTDFGLHVGERFVPYSIMAEFWIIYELPYEKALHLRLNTGVIKELKLDIGDANPELLRKYLKETVAEKEGAKIRLIELLLKIIKL